MLLKYAFKEYNSSKNTANTKFHVCNHKYVLQCTGTNNSRHSLSKNCFVIIYSCRINLFDFLFIVQHNAVFFSTEERKYVYHTGLV